MLVASEGGVDFSIDPAALGITGSVSVNVRQDFIMVTHDKVELCLMKHIKAMEQHRAWVSPLGISLATGTTLATSSFHDAVWIPASTWHAIFALCTAGSLAISVYRFCNRGKAKSIQEIIDEFKISKVTVSGPLSVNDEIASTAAIPAPLAPPTEKS